MENHLYKGHSLYMDNYHNSIDLAHKLLEKKTYCKRTLQSNRKKNATYVIKKSLILENLLVSTQNMAYV